MAHQQSWPFFQNANKPRGTCSRCFAVRQLHLKDVTAHFHGPPSQSCPGSRKLPFHNRYPILSLPLTVLNPLLTQSGKLPTPGILYINFSRPFFQPSICDFTNNKTYSQICQTGLLHCSFQHHVTLSPDY